MVNNSLLMKETNRQKVLSLIRDESLSRADIARATGLSRAAVTLIVDGLIMDGLVLEGDAVRSDTGRRPTMLKIRPEAFVSIGIDVSRAGCNVAFTNFDSEILYEMHVDFKHDANSSVKTLCERIRGVIRERLDTSKILGVGVCCPGPIDSDRGVILNPPGLDEFYNFNIKDAICAELDLPVLLEKDTNALAVSEKNACKLNGDLLFLLADHGIGGGVIKDGKLFCAKGGMGCEIGHVTLKFDGERCRCGNIGCAELYASIPAILNKAERALGERVDWQTLVKMATDNDGMALSVMHEYAAILATVCTGAVNLFEPDFIVLGGELKSATHILKPEIEKKLECSTLSRSARKVCVQRSALGENSRAFATSELVIENYLNGG